MKTNGTFPPITQKGKEKRREERSEGGEREVYTMKHLTLKLAINTFAHLNSSNFHNRFRKESNKDIIYMYGILKELYHYKNNSRGC